MPNNHATAHEAAYSKLKDSIRQTYPSGWFVAIADDRVVAASADFQEVKQLVRDEGFDPRNVLIVETGSSEPDYVDILVLGRDS